MTSHLMKDLDISAFSLGLMSSVYFYTYTAMQIPSGLLFDRFKPKNIIASAIVICSLGAMLFGTAHSFYFACLFRLLMGLGSAFAFVSVLVVASDLFHQKYFALIAGITQMLAALGAMSGQLPVSMLVDHLGWRLTMISLGIFGLILAVIVWFLLNYEKVIIKMCPQHKSEHKSWLSSIKHDLKIILRNKQNWFVAGYACLLWAPMSGFASLWGVPFLIHTHHLSATQAAFASSMMWLGLAIGSPLLGFFSNALKNKIIPLWLSALIGAVAFFFVIETQASLFIITACLFLSGAACSGQALSFAVVTQNNIPSVKSTAIAFNNMAVVISGALFQPLLGWLMPHQMAMPVIFSAYLTGFLLSVFLISQK